MFFKFPQTYQTNLKCDNENEFAVFKKVTSKGDISRRCALHIQKFTEFNSMLQKKKKKKKKKDFKVEFLNLVKLLLIGFLIFLN